MEILIQPVDITPRSCDEGTCNYYYCRYMPNCPRYYM